MSRRRTKVSQAPLAVASDGTVLLNVAHAADVTDPRKLVDAVMAEGAPVFVGVTARPGEVATMLGGLDDPFVEVVALAFGARRRRRPR
jgi:hypothetical protein